MGFMTIMEEKSTVAEFCTLGKAVIATEAQAISALGERIDETFSQACNLLLQCKGRIVVIGMGKSGHIGSKIAATLASTGTPAFFVHPGEAQHGDMGMITPSDVIIAISHSGETPEILSLVPIIKRFMIPLIAMSGHPNSSLAKAATLNLDVSIAQEACPLGLAPTTSTTASLVMGDALAIALLETRGFTSNDFALFHPGGSLGRRLLLHVSDIMHKGHEMPIVGEHCLLDDALVEITQKRLGMTAIVNDSGALLGIFTDGDLRRVIDNRHDIRCTEIHTVMTRDCVTISPKTLAVDALQTMELHKITALLVIDESNRPVGAVHMHDLLRAGVV